MNEEELKNIDISFYLVEKARSLDDLYQARHFELKNEVIEDVRKKVQKSLNFLRVGDNKSFLLEPYNNEMQKKEYIAVFNLEDEEELKEKVKCLLTSFNVNSNIETDVVKFQVLKMSLDDENVFFIYYRGISTASARKAKVRTLAFLDRDSFVLHNHDFLEIGGNIEVFIYQNKLFIVSPRTMEYTFDYKDHITQRRDEVINNLVNQEFFGNREDQEFFRGEAKKYNVARRLANIQSKDIDFIIKNFEARCDEIKDILNNPIYTAEEIGVLKEVAHHLNLEKKIVEINQQESIEGLIDFFAHKIKLDFITKSFERGI